MFTSSPRRRSAGGFIAAAAAHALIFAMLIAVIRSARTIRAPTDCACGTNALVWIAGDGGGGGGGGNHDAGPARRLERSGRDRASLPAHVPAPTTPRPTTAPEPDSVDTVVIPVTPIGSAITNVMGLIDTPLHANTPSQGLGSDGGAGNGRHGGIGDDDGAGLGPGRGGNTGGDVYRDGASGVGRPVPIFVAQPRYTNEAMRARVQGTVVVECVVRVTGVCSDIRVVRSLDRSFGLDEEAKRTVALWRFRPGTRLGQPVPVLVHIELQFNVR